MTEPITKLYRYEASKCSNGVDEWDNPYPGYSTQVYQHKYTVVKHTPKGVWIRYSTKNSDKKFVLLSGKKRFAHPTDEEALHAFIIRKQYHMGHLNSQLCFIKKAIGIAETKLNRLNGR